MDFHEVVIRIMQGDRLLEILQFFAEWVREPGQPAAVHPQRVILFFDVRSANTGNN